ncbi:MAG: C40 family peptidase, partial [Armatimonadetes bacterium]|nr:C40 family peptidase [Armatimonadota bacterium]
MLTRTLVVVAVVFLFACGLAQSTYTVKKGDTLSDIASKFGCKVSALAKKNGITDAKSLQPGRVLRLPESPESYLNGRAPTLGKVKVSATDVNVRNGPSTEHERIAGVAKGTLATVLERQEDWYRLRFPNGTVGWVRGDLLSTVSSAKTVSFAGTYTVLRGDNDWKIARKLEVTLSALHQANPGVDWELLRIGRQLNIPRSNGSRIATPQVTVRGDYVNVRSGPGTEHKRITAVSKGTVATVLARDGDWYKLRFPKGTVGYVRGDLLNPYSRNASAAVAAQAPADPSALALIVEAKKLLGTRYVYGGSTTRGFDCSGFVMYLYRQVEGVKIPRTSRSQSTFGQSVKKSELQPGDVVFFRTRNSSRVNHAGMYIGGGEFIHASSAKNRVRINRLDTGYYSQRFMGARRIKPALKTLDGGTKSAQPSAEKP